MGDRVFDLLAPGAEWPYVREHLSGIQFYIDMVNKAPAEKLKQFAQLIRERKYQVAIECGGTLDFAPMNSTNGERSAAIELAKIDKFYAAGGKVDFLNIDGPIRRLMHPKNKRRGSFDSVDNLPADQLSELGLSRGCFLPRKRTGKAGLRRLRCGSQGGPEQARSGRHPARRCHR
jgi:hypothetical protein